MLIYNISRFNLHGAVVRHTIVHGLFSYILCLLERQDRSSVSPCMAVTIVLVAKLLLACIHTVVVGFKSSSSYTVETNVTVSIYMYPYCKATFLKELQYQDVSQQTIARQHVRYTTPINICYRYFILHMHYMCTLHQLTHFY